MYDDKTISVQHTPSSIPREDSVHFQDSYKQFGLLVKVTIALVNNTLQGY